MFQVEYFPLSKGETAEAVNYIDYSTLTANEGIVEIDNVEGTNIIFIPNISDFIDYEDDNSYKYLSIKLKNLVPCKVIINMSDETMINKIIGISNFNFSEMNSTYTYQTGENLNNIVYSYCTDMEEAEENNINIKTDGLNTTIIYEMKEYKYKYNGILESKYLVDCNIYYPFEN